MICKSLFWSTPALARLLLAVAAVKFLQSIGALAQTTSRYDSFRFGVCYFPEKCRVMRKQIDGKRH
jgi:hypothetical protein